MRIPIFVITLALASSCVHAQTVQKKPTKSGAELVKPAPPYDLMPFDPKVQTLTPHYAGADLEQLWALLNKQSSVDTKGEFETQSQYQSRLESLQNSPIAPHFRRTDLLAVVLPLEPAKYDADKQELPIYLPYSINSFSNQGATLWQWSRHYTRGPGYVGSNSFGASVNVDIAQSIDYNIIASLPAWLDKRSYSQFDTAYQRSRDLRQVILKLNPQVAQRIKPTLKALVIGTLLTPSTDEDTRHDGPTIDSPIDFKDVSRNVHLLITEFWIFNDSTGEVGIRYSATSLPQH
jgi:hypothetical protein